MHPFLTGLYTQHRQTLLACLTAYTICLVLRLLELPQWNPELYYINGEPILGTHDAYGWLAGAKGVGRMAGRNMSQVMAWLHGVTGLPYGTIAMYLPVLIAPLAAVPVCLLCSAWGFTEGGVLAGTVTGGTLGYLFRTRLTYADTDIWALPFALFLTAALVLWLKPVTRRIWTGRSKDQESDIPTLFPFLLKAALIGLATAAYMWLYSKAYPIVVAIVFVAATAGFLLSPRSCREKVLQGIALVFALGTLGWIGLAVTLATLVLAWLKQEILEKTGVGIALLAAVVVLGLFISPYGHGLVGGTLGPLTNYAGLDREQEPDSNTLSLPDSRDSTLERQTGHSFKLVAENVSIHWSVFILGCAGLGFLLLKHPLALTLLPFFFLGLSTFTLGSRFAMFGGASIGTGLAFLICWSLSRYGLSTCKRWIVLASLTLIIAVPPAVRLLRAMPQPVLSHSMAETLTQLAEKTPEDARIWVWWSIGYPAQYFAERPTYADNGINGRDVLYPLSLAFASHSVLQTSQVMHYFDSSEAMQQLGSMAPKEAQSFVEGLTQEKKEWPSADAPQYMVLGWEYLKSVGWMNHYATWDLATGYSTPGTIMQLDSGQYDIDTTTGMFITPQRKYPLQELHLFKPSGNRVLTWKNPAGFYFLYNETTQEAFLMDRQIRNTMALRMLLEDPDTFSDHFELIVDKSPWSRVYRLKHN